LQVRITGCSITTNDDHISLKSGKDAEGLAYNKATTNVLIDNNHFGYGGGENGQALNACPQPALSLAPSRHGDWQRDWGRHQQRAHHEQHLLPVRIQFSISPRSSFNRSCSSAMVVRLKTCPTCTH
jgi:hypothetical protein